MTKTKNLLVFGQEMQNPSQSCYVRNAWKLLQSFLTKVKIHVFSRYRLLSNNVMAFMNMKGKGGKREFGTSPIYGVVNG